MAKATNKHKIIKKLFKSHGIVAGAVVILCVSIGAVAVPNMFAATAAYSIDSINAAPVNNGTHNIQVTWTGNTPYRWLGTTIAPAGNTHQWESTAHTRNKLIGNLKCGQVYTFKVTPVNSSYQSVGNTMQVSASSPCPGVAWTSFTSNGTTVAASWRGTVSYPQTYKLFIKAGNGGYSPITTTGTSHSFAGACGTTYSAYLTAEAGGQASNQTPVQTVSTAGCPQAPAAPPRTTTPPRSSGGSSRAPATAPAAAPTPPAAPNSFSAEVTARKIVILRWDAVEGAAQYKIARSTDNQNWQDIAAIQNTSYDDSDTEFSTMYYYKVRAVNAANQDSPEVGAQIETQVFERSNKTITSSDKSVVITVPDGAIAGEFNCSVKTTSANVNKLPTDQNTLNGPYDLTCINAEGDPITSYEEPIQVVMKLAAVSAGHENFGITTYHDNKWQSATSKYNVEKQELSFTLTSKRAFAVLGTRQSSSWGIIGAVLLILLIIAAVVAGVFLLLRRRANREPAYDQSVAASGSPSALPVMPIATRAVTSAQQEVSAEEEFRHALEQPDCSHVSMAQQVIPTGQGCLDCETEHTKWRALRICLVCGHVGCSDDSNQQHALKHYQQTGHPIIYEYGNPAGNTLGWCYIDETYI